MIAIRIALNIWLSGSIGWSLLTLWRMHAPLLHLLVALISLITLAWLTSRWPGRVALALAVLILAVSAGIYFDVPHVWPLLRWIGRLQLDYVETATAWRSGNPVVPQGHIATVLLALTVYAFSLLVWLSGARPRRALTTAASGGLILSAEWLVHHDAAVMAAAIFLPGALTLMAAARAAELTSAVAAAETAVLRTAPLVDAPSRTGARQRAFTWVHVRVVALAVLAALLLTGAGLVLPSDYATADLGIWRDRLQQRFPLLADLRGTALRRIALTFDLQQLGYGGSEDELGGPVRTSNAIALNVSVRGGNLPASLYLRGRSPAYYTGRGWVPGAEGPVRTGLDAPSGQFSPAASGTSLIADIEPQGLRTRTLFTVLEPVRLQTPGRVTWLGDHTATVDPAPVTGNTYQVIARQPLYSTEEIFELTETGDNALAHVPDEYLSIPVTLPDRVGRLAADIVDGIEHPFDRIVAIETFLRDYDYDLEAARPPAGADFVDHFLFESRAGYCVYHATAMTVMLRTIGIPARYVTGFRVDIGHQAGDYAVRNEMAHAWVEAYLPGYGWMTFEPTPAFPVPDRSYARDRSAPETGATASPQTPVPPLFPTEMLPEKFDGGPGGSAGSTGADPARAARLAWLATAAAALLAAGIWTARTVAADRGPRPGTPGAPIAVFTLATKLFARSGMPMPSGLTATERIGHASRRWPTLSGPLQTLLRLYLPARYGGAARDAGLAPVPSHSDADEAALAAWQKVRGGIRKYQGFFRYYARLLRQAMPRLSILRRRRGGGRSAT